MRTATHDTDQNSVWAPFMVINPGETLIQARARHRRETGHVGAVIICAINGGHQRRNRPARLNASLSVA